MSYDACTNCQKLSVVAVVDRVVGRIFSAVSVIVEGLYFVFSTQATGKEKIHGN